MNLLATDLDRTLFHNGKEPYEEGSMEELKELLKKNNVSVIFVTGRYKELVKEGIKDYNPPLPSYVIADVGTSIYKYENGEFIRDEDWDEELKKIWKNHDRFFIREVLKDFEKLKEQEEIKLNKFKQSYYLEDEEEVELVKEKLEEEGIPAEVIYSYDTEERTSLLDIQPKGVSKEGAIRFLIKKIGVDEEKVVYSGDSGNDLHPLIAFKGILVGNANSDLKKLLKNKVYQAKSNYSAGIIEGCKYYNLFS